MPPNFLNHSSQVLLLFLLLFLLLSHGSMASEASSRNHIDSISAPERGGVGAYVSFLNESASIDFEGLYDEKMNSISRSGDPGSYHYEVLEGKECASMNYIDWSSAQHYFNWLEYSASSFCSSSLQSSASSLSSACDERLRSNHMLVEPREESARNSQKNSGGTSDSTPAEVLGKILLGVFAAIEMEEVTAPNAAIREHSSSVSSNLHKENNSVAESVVPNPAILKDDITTLSTGALMGFLRSPDEKKKILEKMHTQAAQDLKGRHHHLSEQITTWEMALYNKHHYCFLGEREEKGKEVAVLTSSMPTQLQSLAALSRAMDLMDDAWIFRNPFLQMWDATTVVDKSGKPDPNAVGMKLYLLRQVDALNTHLQQFEKIADMIIEYSALQERCLTLAIAETAAGHTDIAEKFQEAADFAKQAILSYAPWSQKMKDGAISEAELLHLEGLRLHFRALECDYTARSMQATAQGNEEQARNLKNAAWSSENAAETFERVSQAKTQDQLKVVAAYEQAAHYLLQRVEASVQGDDEQMENLQKATVSCCKAAEAFQQATEDGIKDQPKTVAAYEQAARYQLQRAEANAEGNGEQAENLKNAATSCSKAALFFKETAEGRNKSYPKAAKAQEQAIRYWLQCAQAWAQGNQEKATDLEKAANMCETAEVFLRGNICNSYDILDIPLANKQLQCAKVYANEGTAKGDALAREINDWMARRLSK